ncbi:hypothetical protein TPHA_0H00960 [Tetrapisispora phaffii CBS 4417]|uniref:Condensation domain-containing protein n=1 Tax=Tetrapisispora phaffii (strain ATCC 24235 / CBS 4417 / NBRC 1672 / NRRL Y-8282 / UCD 70-5) TaxID=1071381 RepID=G8BX00_TETPH|nr:hypothetical protein TPHA_0H00960 [Tetrapisispora phaffii CBS 4417]CCE64304.1 hypothetical protein TPHA_0H00960 [Tetrapisispora phaffii CBS 4417]
MKLRELSGTEKFFFSRSVLNLHTCFYVTVKLNKLPTENELCSSLRKVIAKNRILRCNINKNGDSAYINDIIENDNEFTVQDVIEYRDWNKFEEDEQNSVFQEINFKYGELKPLWKLIIASKINTIVLAMDHTFFDGSSATLFWKALLLELSSIDRDQLEDTDVVFSKANIDDNYITALDISSNNLLDDCPISFASKIKRFIASKIFQYFPYTIIAPNSELLQFDDYSFPSSIFEDGCDKPASYKLKNNSRRAIINIKPAQISNVLKYCRSKNIALTSYLSALISYYVNIYKDKSVNHGSAIKVEIPINLRGILKEKLEMDIAPDFGCYISSTDLVIDSQLNGSTIDKLASTFQKQISNSVKENVDETIENIKITEVIDSFKFFEYKVTPKPSEDKIFPGATFEVTNLGRVSFETKNDNFFVEDALFGGSQSLTTIFTCYVISTDFGGMNLAITYSDSIKDFMEPVIEKCKAELLSL